MAKYLILYRADKTMNEQMSGSTPEEMKAGMDAWNAWAGKAGSAIVDFGNPTNPVDDAGGGQPVGGYSILEATDADALDQILEGHPHAAQGGTIAIYEIMPMPGM
ncbi:YciI family protein [Hamadaea sp. NPDC051192]|uniref:YciI family protein n=1 Tax=Hamadaea sp. NPDC051192 TaxID=3154940 RepID=UPI00344980D8